MRDGSDDDFRFIAIDFGRDNNNGRSLLFPIGLAGLVLITPKKLVMNYEPWFRRWKRHSLGLLVHERV